MSKKLIQKNVKNYIYCYSRNVLTPTFLPHIYNVIQYVQTKPIPCILSRLFRTTTGINTDSLRYVLLPGIIASGMVQWGLLGLQAEVV